MFEIVQGISGHTNKPGLTVVKWLCVESSATKKAWDGAMQIMVVDRTFLKGHIFDQVVLLAVTCDSNNNQILLLYTTVTSEIEDTWVWFRHQLEQSFQGLMSLLQITQRWLRVISSKMIFEILDACLHIA